ncbi:MAG: hypothetical protein QXF23_06660 [Candidatus Bathyarchaeia archaeon]
MGLSIANFFAWLPKIGKWAINVSSAIPILSVSETIMRVSIADIADRNRLAIAYGIFGML